jgi:hypothetical protein
VRFVPFVAVFVAFKVDFAVRFDALAIAVASAVTGVAVAEAALYLRFHAVKQPPMRCDAPRAVAAAVANVAYGDFCVVAVTVVIDAVVVVVVAAVAVAVSAIVFDVAARRSTPAASSCTIGATMSMCVLWLINRSVNASTHAAAVAGAKGARRTAAAADDVDVHRGHSASAHKTPTQSRTIGTCGAAVVSTINT